MSLINEALRKARQEAAEQEAEQKGAAYRPPRAHLPQQSKLGMGLALGVVFGAVVAILVGGVAWVLLAPSSSTGAVSTSAVAPEVVAPSSSAPNTTNPQPARAISDPGDSRAVARDPATSTGSGPAPSVSSAGGSREAPRFDSRSTTPPEAPIPDSVGSPTLAVSQLPSNASARPAESPAAAVPPPSPPTVPAPNPSSQRPPNRSSDLSEEPAMVSADGSSEGPDGPRLIQPPDTVGQVGKSNTFVLEADLGDVTLVLDFIVWSESNPFAQINGKQVEVGQLVEGFLVESIQRDRVELRASDGTVVLRVR